MLTLGQVLLLYGLLLGLIVSVIVLIFAGYLVWKTDQYDRKIRSGLGMD